MGRLIDTSIFIEAERGRLDLDRSIKAAAREPIFMSVISVSELLHGVHRASSKFRKKRLETIEKWIECFSILEIDILVAREHAELHAQLKTEGQLIGVHDQWLAATCLVHDLTIVTANVREFDRVSRLNVENWAISEG